MTQIAGVIIGFDEYIPDDELIVSGLKGAENYMVSQFQWPNKPEWNCKKVDRRFIFLAITAYVKAHGVSPEWAAVNKKHEKAIQESLGT